jgi:para-nitrobenzyl esterase
MRKTFDIFLRFCLVLLIAAPALAAIKQPVAVTGGRISGVAGKDSSILVFKGIPFAAPPVGKLRWREPQPVVSWSGVKAADRFGASCMQTIVQERKPWTYEFMAHNEISEDCLTLNVWTSAANATEKRPVFFYIYGGGFNEGSSAVPVYDGEGLAKKGLVVVTVNYRVGLLGFFAHPELTKESPNHTSGNYGLLDQVAALKWVQANIAKFGGDPARVTIAGQSAGAASVLALTASPLAKRLFARGIAQSGAAVNGGLATGGAKLEQAEAAGAAFATAKGAKSIADLRAMTYEKLTEPVPGGRGGRGGMIVDGWFLTQSVAEVYSQSKNADIPMMTGWTKNDINMTSNPTLTATAFQAQAKQRYGDSADQFLKLYPAVTDEQARASSMEATWDQNRTAMYLWARARARSGKSKTFTYFYDHVMPGPDASTYGAFHTSEVPYAMNTLGMSDRPFTEADHKVADQVSSYWVNFVLHGDPNRKGLPVWPAIAEKSETMEIGDKPGAIPVAGSAEKFAFWERFLTK